MVRMLIARLRGAQLSLFGPRTRATVRVSRDLIHDRRQLIDQRLADIWAGLQLRFFPERTDLLSYRLSWSRRRQKRTLASCNLEQRRVIVAKELDDERFLQWLEPLLYHEMCHAVLGDQVGKRQGKRMWHGKEFKAIERRHPQIAALDDWIRRGGFAYAVRSHRARGARRRA